MARSHVRSVLVGSAILWLASWALADAEGDYKALFGQEEAKVAASRNTKDAAAFAAKLLNAAKTLGEQKDLQALLCEKAYEFGSKDPSGQQTAVDALKLLGEAAPDKKTQAQEKLLKTLQSRFAKSTGADRKRLGEELMDLLVARGDERAEAKESGEAVTLYRQALSIATSVGAEQTKEIMDKIKGISSALEGEKKLAGLKARLDADPKNTAVRTSLILAYLGELDNPAEAAKLASPDLDEQLRTYLPLAAKPLAELEEGPCLELAYWYAELADKASAAGKGILLGRAKEAGERFLKLHSAQDTARLKGTMLLDKVTKGAADLAPRLRFGLPKTLVLDLGNNVKMKLVLIPAGKFMMGSPAGETGHGSSEGPLHEVRITKPFYMGVTEVTRAQFAAFAKETDYVSVAEEYPDRIYGFDKTGTWQNIRGASWQKTWYSQSDQHPAACIHINDGLGFCTWATKKTGYTVRLPSEAEWEYACRAGSQRSYCFGDNPKGLAQFAWHKDNSQNQPHPVGGLRPNAFGLYDMHGNVGEWCIDFYTSKYSEKPAEDPVITVAKDPKTGSWDCHVARGGTWATAAAGCRSGARGPCTPSQIYNFNGFRVVAEVGKAADTDGKQ